MLKAIQEIEPLIIKARIRILAYILRTVRKVMAFPRRFHKCARPQESGHTRFCGDLNKYLGYGLIIRRSSVQVRSAPPFKPNKQRVFNGDVFEFTQMKALMRTFCVHELPIE